MTRRRLFGLGAVATLLGWTRVSAPVSAADGDDILAGRLNNATATTHLTGDGKPEVFRVTVESGAASAIDSQGGPPGLFIAGTGLVALGPENIRATGGDAETGPAGHGAVATGGMSRGLGGGVGLEATGGPADSGRGGAGVFARGQTAVKARGGNSAQRGKQPGIGLVAIGGGAPGRGASGLLGTTRSAEQAAVVGRNAGGGPGVRGQSLARIPDGDMIVGGSGTGVRGMSQEGPGGRFESQSGTGAVGSSTNRPGATGRSSSAEGASGLSESGAGARGDSVTGYGVMGASITGRGGIFETDNPTAFAAAFFNAAGGTLNNPGLGLFVNGNFVVEEGTKSAAVETSRGLRLLYCTEATTSVFEDFGRARLENGKARVTLDPVFAEAVDGSRYWVFVTPRSATTKGLAVVARDPGGFTVEETQGGTGTYELDYRVVAQRRGLTPAHRLARAPRPVAGRS